MSFIHVINLMFIVTGVIIVIAALVMNSRKQKAEAPIVWRQKVSGGVDLDTALRQIDERRNEIDKSLEEFHSTANSAIVELDEKYQELLFLYSLIDEKKKEVADIYSAPPKPAEAAAPAAKPKAAPEIRAAKTKSSHPRRKDILNLSKQGLSVSEIAEELNVGQDMVKLILELGKAR